MPKEGKKEIPESLQESFEWKPVGFLTKKHSIPAIEDAVTRAFL